MKTKQIRISAGVALVAILAFIFWPSGEENNQGGPGGRGGWGGNEGVAVAVAPVTRDTIRDMRSLTGTLEAQSRFSVAPKVSGRLLRLEVGLGDRVERGQLVGVLDDDEYYQSVLQSEAELEVAKANAEEARSDLLVAEREFERVQTLRVRRVASEADLEAAEARLSAQEARVRVTEATIQQREAALEAARVRLGYTRIHATWDGGPDYLYVGERFVEAGDSLPANQPIVSLVDLERLRAVVQVTERDYGRIRVGQDGMLVADSYPGEVFHGTVERMAPVFRETSRQARMELAVENPEGKLKPGMFVRVQLELARAENVLSVRRDAVVRRDGQQGVFMVDREENISRFVPVTVGFSEGVLTQILEPELSGDVVVVGQDRLYDGANIRIAREETVERPVNHSSGQATAQTRR